MHLVRALRTGREVARILSPRQRAWTLTAGVAAAAVVLVAQLPLLLAVIAGGLAVVAAGSLVSVRVEAQARAAGRPAARSHRPANAWRLRHTVDSLRRIVDDFVERAS